ncbi:MAG: FliH/SctL family protein [Pseudobdellovibrionaceae bacterium]
MPWFKTNLEGPRMDGHILKADVAQETVLEFVPPKIQIGTAKSALAYIERSRNRSDFVMAEPLKRQTGVDEIELMDEDQKVELKVLQRIKEIQEKAYEEAYQLGLEDGRKMAFDKNLIHLQQCLQEFNLFLTSISAMKNEILKQNERHVIDLIYQTASKVCMQEIKDNPELIISIVKQVLQASAEQENVTVRISEEQHKFIEEFLQHQQKTFAEYPNIQFQADPSIQNGGCTVETNFSVIDATIETRLQVIWDQVRSQMPVAKPKLVS